MAKTDPARPSGSYAFTVESVYPTDPKAIERLKRGDTVPFDECGWVLARAGDTCKPGDLNPFVLASLTKQGFLVELKQHVPLPVELTGQSGAPVIDEGEA